MTTANKRGLNADPWRRPPLISNSLVNPSVVLTAVLQSSYVSHNYIMTNFFLIPLCLKLSVGLNTLSRSTKPENIARFPSTFFSTTSHILLCNILGMFVERIMWSGENYVARLLDILRSIGLPILQSRKRYKIKPKMLLNYLLDIFTSTNEIHDYTTRQSKFNLRLPKPNTKIYKIFRGAEVWNRLSSELKLAK